LKDPLIKSPYLDYNSVKVGQTLLATIIEVNEKDKFIKLSLNDFVKGKLHLEHMSDYPLKVIPPKFRETGKTIKVRVWNVEADKRSIEFTKKETFIKDKDSKVPVY
jgi:ribosomal protein S1